MSLPRFIAKDAAQLDEVNAVPISSDVSGYYRMASDRNQIMAGIMHLFGGLNVIADGSRLVIDPMFGSAETYTHIGDNVFVTQEGAFPLGVYINSDEHGEIMDIDGITGGFNFQNAWTSGWIAGSHMAKNPLQEN